MAEDKADQIYEDIKRKLNGQNGKIVAIDPDSGDYFVGEDVLDAFAKGRAKYPTKTFTYFRIGRKYVYFIGAVSA